MKIANDVRWLQSILDKAKKLLPWMKLSNGGYDYARRKKLDEFGKRLYKFIESNMGVESSMWYDTPEQVHLVNKLLFRYGKALKRGEIADEALTPEQQVTWIRQFAQENELDLEKTFPGYRIHDGGMEQPYKPIAVNEKYVLKKIGIGHGCGGALRAIGVDE